jgi:hypothetical protein
VKGVANTRGLCPVTNGNGSSDPLRMGDIRRSQLVAESFRGFLTFGQLRSGGIAQVPDGPGICVVLRESDEAPSFSSQTPVGADREPARSVQAGHGGPSIPVAPAVLSGSVRATSVQFIEIGKTPTVVRPAEVVSKSRTRSARIP